MVTEAIGAALDDIVHFRVVFMVVFAAFVVAGWVLLGPMHQELRYLTHAMRGDCDGNGIIYGENDVPRFKYTPYICAWIRFTLLQLFVAVLLLNMVIVIRADAFVQGRGETPPQTLPLLQLRQGPKLIYFLKMCAPPHASSNYVDKGFDDEPAFNLFLPHADFRPG